MILNYNLTINECRVIIYLSQVNTYNYDGEPCRRSTTISKKLNINQGNLSNLLASMKNKGYIYRMPESKYWYVSKDSKYSLRKQAKEVLWNARQNKLSVGQEELIK